VLALAGLTPDYIALVGEDFTELPEQGVARMLIACKVGDVRLIDNAAITIGATAAQDTSEYAPTINGVPR
jgi:pantothenate synthetase